MMDPPVQPDASSTHAMCPASHEDDDTVVTPSRGEKRVERDNPRVEKTLKFRFVPSPDNDNVHPAILHVHWMHELKQHYGEDIQFIDNRNRPVTKLDPLRIDPAKHMQNFKLYFDRHTNRKSTNKDNTDYRKDTSYIVHRIQTSVTLGEMKATNTVIKLMKEQNFYVNEHKWSETDWETTQLGFVYGIDPQFHDLDQATNIVAKALQSSVPRKKIPKFRLVYSSPKIRNGKGKTVKTKAYSIETLRSDRDELTKLLKIAYKEDGTFVPFQMRTRHPDAFERFIRAQTQMISANYVVILNHIGPDAMHYLSERILAISGVISLLPCRSVHEDGRYKVLVHQKNFHCIRAHLKEVIPTWYEQYVEPDAKAPEFRYPGKPEVSPIDSDGFSQAGNQSYMTISINTAMSIGSTISNGSPPSYVYQSERHVSTDTSTIGGSKTTSSSYGRSWADTIRDSSLSSIQHLRSTKDSLGHNHLKEDLEISRAEVAALKLRLAQLEDENAQQQGAIEEKVKTQVASALHEQFSSFAQEMKSMFTQMMISQQQIQEHKTAKRQQDAIIENSEEDDRFFTGNVTIAEDKKRRDNKPTPQKTKFTARHEDNDQKMWMTPTQLSTQMSSQPVVWTDCPRMPPHSNSPDSANFHSAKERHAQEIKLRPVGIDCKMQGSSIESKNKPSAADDMDVEAFHDNHDERL